MATTRYTVVGPGGVIACFSTLAALRLHVSAHPAREVRIDDLGDGRASLAIVFFDDTIAVGVAPDARMLRLSLRRWRNLDDALIVVDGVEAGRGARDNAIFGGSGREHRYFLHFSPQGRVVARYRRPASAFRVVVDVPDSVSVTPTRRGALATLVYPDGGRLVGEFIDHRPEMAARRLRRWPQLAGVAIEIEAGYAVGDNG